MFRNAFQKTHRIQLPAGSGAKNSVISPAIECLEGISLLLVGGFVLIELLYFFTPSNELSCSIFNPPKWDDVAFLVGVASTTRLLVCSVSQWCVHKSNMTWDSGCILRGSERMDGPDGTRGAIMETFNFHGIVSGGLKPKESWASWRHLSSAHRFWHLLRRWPLCGAGGHKRRLLRPRDCHHK